MQLVNPFQTKSILNQIIKDKKIYIFILDKTDKIIECKTTISDLKEIIQIFDYANSMGNTNAIIVVNNIQTNKLSHIILAQTLVHYGNIFEPIVLDYFYKDNKVFNSLAIEKLLCLS